MMLRRSLLFALLVVTGISTNSQAPPSPQAIPPDALLYERDFELLLEEAGVPTLGQLELDRQIAAIAPEISAADKKMTGLRKRLKVLDNNYTLEDLAEELARQGVSDIRVAQARLKAQIQEVEIQVETLARKERELKERRNR